MSQLRQQASRVYQNIDWNRAGAYRRAMRVNRAFQNASKGLSNG